jgi:hypothetical protein
MSRLGSFEINTIQSYVDKKNSFVPSPSCSIECEIRFGSFSDKMIGRAVRRVFDSNVGLDRFNIVKTFIDGTIGSPLTINTVERSYNYHGKNLREITTFDDSFDRSLSVSYMIKDKIDRPFNLYKKNIRIDLAIETIICDVDCSSLVVQCLRRKQRSSYLTNSGRIDMTIVEQTIKNNTSITYEIEYEINHDDIDDIIHHVNSLLIVR